MNIDIVSEHLRLEKDFINHFAKAGLAIHEESPLLINDPTILFTNSTIAPLKSLILSHSIPKPGIALAQQCLRNQNFKGIYSSNKHLEYMSYFRMLGVLISSNCHDQLIDEIINYFFEVEMIEARKIICKATKLKHFESTILDRINSKNIKIEFDSYPINYYEWKYGLDSLEGIGLTFAIETSDNTFQDIGNLIQLKYENELIGYEFGFGIETFLARKYGLENPFHASKIAKTMPLQADPNIHKLQDAIVVGIVLLQHGILPSRGKRNSIVKKAISIICYFSKLLNITNNELYKIFVNFITLEFGNDSNSTADLLFQLIESHSVRLNMRMEEFICFATKNKLVLSSDEIIKEGSLKQQLDPDIAYELLQTAN